MKSITHCIITDGVFSMDGDLAPLPKMADLADQYNALLVVDDAHGDGVMGPAGRGTVDHFGLRDRIIIETGSLSKAFGSAGGFVAGPKEFIEALRPKARSFIFTASPMAPCLTAAAAKAVDLVMENTALVDKLWENRNYFADRLSKLGEAVNLLAKENKLPKEKGRLSSAMPKRRRSSVK